MKTRLLKKLRRRGRNKITIHSITTQNGYSVGMKYSYDEDEYGSLYSIGDTEKDVKEKAARVYIKQWLKRKKK